MVSAFRLGVFLLLAVGWGPDQPVGPLRVLVWSGCPVEHWAGMPGGL